MTPPPFSFKSIFKAKIWKCHSSSPPPPTFASRLDQHRADFPLPPYRRSVSVLRFLLLLLSLDQSVSRCIGQIRQKCKKPGKENPAASTSRRGGGVREQLPTRGGPSPPPPKGASFRPRRRLQSRDAEDAGRHFSLGLFFPRIIYVLLM